MMEKTQFDFSGYATKSGLKCSDGRVILKDAFKHQDGQKVPIVWQHLHDDPKNTLGHAILENREDGVYCYGKFNETENGKNAKQLVAHGDISFLSIYANQLMEKAKQVMHGAIREVSLVYSGANPGAVIDNLSFAHADGSDAIDESEAFIYTGIEIAHGDVIAADINEPTVAEVFNGMTEAQQNAVKTMLAHALGEDGEINEGDEETDPALEHAEDKTVKDVFDTLNEEQKKVVYFLIGNALNDSGDGTASHSGDDPDNNNNEGESVMKINVFDQNAQTKTNSLTHAQLGEIVGTAKQCGSWKEAFVKHATEYGFDPIDILFPEVRDVRPGGPDTIKRDDSWVPGVLAAISKTPFAKIRTRFADLTEDEARAKGYITGSLKKEELIKLMKRVTQPTTVYKKQKLDRDDIVDITDFDVVAWLWREMDAMLREELARAVLIGDGRSAADEDKINEDNVRPIVTDDPNVFVHRVIIPFGMPTDNIIDEMIKARGKYKGSGAPTLYTSNDLVTDMRLIKDGMGRRIYASETELASLLRVSSIVEVEVMENATVTIDGIEYAILGIEVNLKDYTLGTNKGGEITKFDDFDIDYNQYKYLIETRTAGALTRYKSAVVILQELEEADG